jgi:hypothetical protein
MLLDITTEDFTICEEDTEVGKSISGQVAQGINAATYTQAARYKQGGSG